MKLSDEKKEVLKKFVNDSDWGLVEEILMAYVKPYKNIDYVNLSDKATDIKAEIKVRRQVYQSMIEFLRQMELLQERKTESNHNPFE